MGELVGRRAINSHHDEGSPAPCACCSPDYWARWPWWHGWLRHGRVWIRLRNGRWIWLRHGHGLWRHGFGHGRWRMAREVQKFLYLQEEGLLRRQIILLCSIQQ